MVRVYESKAKYEINKSWTILVDEIQNESIITFSESFNQGDLFTKISEEFKLKLLSNNPTWVADSIIIE